jgi:hypothetical protein
VAAALRSVRASRMQPLLPLFVIEEIVTYRRVYILPTWLKITVRP